MPLSTAHSMSKETQLTRMDRDSFAGRWTPRMLSILRIVAAFMFMQHGAQKLFGFLGPANATAPELFSQMWVAGVLEFFGGALVLVGWFTRPVAFLLSGLMAVAYFQAHAPRGFWPLQNRGELAALYCFTNLYMVFAGAGAWSIDALLKRRKSAASE